MDLTLKAVSYGAFVIEIPIDSFIQLDGSNASGMKLHWKEPVTVSSDMMLDLFEFVGINQTEEILQMASGKTNDALLQFANFYGLFITANYSRLKLEFEFKRTTGYYIRQVYIPCTMLVVLSWISFWLNRRAFNVRLVITSLSLLVLSIGLNIVGFEIPKTPYNKAIDVFTGVSMTFVFIALVGKFCRFNRDAKLN